MPSALTLVSHELCPYVQRAAIVLQEKAVPFERVYVDLGNKPDWFRSASPLGKVPLLLTRDGQTLFESAAIVEFLDETTDGQLHPECPLERARHRAYIEFASQTLNGIGILYNATDAAGFETASAALRTRFAHLEQTLAQDGPFFAGEAFSLADAAFGPVFRYFDVFEGFADLGVFDGLTKVGRWRQALSDRPSVREAVGADYHEALRTFLTKRGTHISRLTERSQTAQRKAAE